DFTTGQVTRGEFQLDEVKKDVAKLRAEKKHRQKLPRNEAIRGHVLVWGVYAEDGPKDHPVEFFRNLGKDVELHALRWLPLWWPQPSRPDPTDPDRGIPKTRVALWIGLAEVDPPKSEAGPLGRPRHRGNAPRSAGGYDA